jgi:hypothetical protein
MPCSSTVKINIKIISIHHSIFIYHGYRKRDNLKDSVPRDSRRLNSAEVYNCIHTDNGTNLHTPGLVVRVTSRSPTFPNLARMSDDRFERLPGHVQRHSRPMPNPLASITDKPVMISSWLIAPIHDMWSVRVAIRSHVSQYTVLNAPRATSSEIPSHNDLPLA